MTEPQLVREPEEEQEVDLASAWQRLTLRWWLPVGGLVAGAVIGLALALSGGTTWRAETLLFLGQPFAPLGGGQIQSLATNPRTVDEIVRSEAALRDAAAASGIPVSKLRTSISTREVVAPGQARGITPLIELSVKGSPKRRTELAAKALADRVVASVSVYVEKKVDLLQRQVEVAEAQLASVEARIQRAQEQQDALAQNSALAPVEKLLLSQNLNAVITTADARRSALQDDLHDAEQLLNLADSVEKSRVVEPAVAARTNARSSRTSLLVGALVGLLLGGVVALAVEPILARRPGRGATPEG
jgi:hypothetical protein